MNVNADVLERFDNTEAYLMKKCCKILDEEIKIIKKIQSDEIWLEGERRHCEVSKEDSKVKEKTEQVIMEHLQEIEEEALSHCYVENNEDCKKCKICIKGK